MTSQEEEYERIFRLARPELPGALDDTMQRMMYEVLFEFFDLSNVWIQTLPFNVLANTQLYTIVPNPPGQTLRFLSLFDQNNIPQVASMPQINTIMLRDPQNNVATWTLKLIMTVSLPTGQNNLPDVYPGMLSRYSPIILDGLIAKMMNQPAKPYSNSTLAAYHAKRFLNGCATAKVDALRSNTFGTNSWAYPQQFRTRTQRGGVSVGNSGEF